MEYGSEILLDDLVTYITQFIPREDWFAFQLVSKQLLRCARKLVLTAIRPNDDDLIRVCQKGNFLCVRMLLGVYNVDPSINDNVVIRLASYFGNLEVVALLLSDPRVNPSTDGNAAIRVASRQGHHAVVALLLADARVDPSARCNQAIDWAKRNGHHVVVDLLISDPRVDSIIRYNLAISSIVRANRASPFINREVAAASRIDPSRNH